MTVRKHSDIAAIEEVAFQHRNVAQTVYELLERAANAHGDNDAIRYLTTGEIGEAARIWSHETLFRKVNQAIRAFRSLGLARSDALAILLPPLPETHVALWSAASACRALPINLLLKPTHMAELSAEAAVKMVIAVKPSPSLDLTDAVEKIEAACSGFIGVKWVGPGAGESDNFDAWIDSFDGDPIAHEDRPKADDRSIIFHTGGTTGRPKLARLTHRNVSAAVYSFTQMYDLGADDLVINGLPLFHVGGSIDLGLGALSRGAANLIPTATTFRNPTVIANHWHIAREHGATITSGTPTTLGAWLAAKDGSMDTGRLDLCISGGAPLPASIGKGFEEEFGIKVSQTYGMTEAAGFIAAGPRRGSSPPSSTGLPGPYVQVRIASEPSSGKASEGQAVGRVLIKGPNVLDDVVDSEGWLDTGDIGFLDEEGVLWLRGRSKDIIIRSGHNIDPEPIEDLLMSHEAVELAALVARPDSYAGELPVAYVQVKKNASINSAELADWLAPRVSERPAMPKAIHVIDAIPLTAVGKIYKPALRELEMLSSVRMLTDTSGLLSSNDYELQYDSDEDRIAFHLAEGSRADPLQLESVLAQLNVTASIEIVERSSV